MKESYRKGLANHSGPESCGNSREVITEALTGEDAGRVIEPRKQQLPDADSVAGVRKATPRGAEMASAQGTGAVEERGMYGNSKRENRESSSVSQPSEEGSDGKPIRRTSSKNDEQSDERVGPTKSPNKAMRCAAEEMEERRSAKRNTSNEAEVRAQNRVTSQAGIERIRQRARTDKELRFTTLLHHINEELLLESFKELNPKAVAGIDGVTKGDYEQGLEKNIKDLLGRVHRGAYRAKPSKRGYIPKSDEGLRPLGIASLEDKLLQRALTKVLNAIYEEDFLGFSYGFRPHRNPHQALGALGAGIGRKKINYVLDADIRGFFDNMLREWIVKFVEHRVGDTRVLRLIKKWLSAGVIEGTNWEKTKAGSPQGASISPLLANVYLHYVFDLWAHNWRQKYAQGDIVLVRYADDFVVGFEYQEEALQFKTALAERLAKFGLELHPEKTRIIEFGRNAWNNRKRRGAGKPETFDFLGFTHMCAKSKRGGFWIRRKTIKKRFRRALQKVKEGLKLRMHAGIQVQGKWLQRVGVGYFNYHAIPGNTDTLRQWRKQVARYWFQILRRRSHKDKTRWQWFGPVANYWLPPARARLPWLEARFDGITQGRSPVR